MTNPSLFTRIRAAGYPVVLAMAVAMGGGGVATSAHAATFDLPPIDPIAHYQPKLPLQVLTSDGVELAQFGVERREYVPIERIPKMLQDALLAVEDARFREHSGVDPKGMARAVVSMLTGGRRQGASTITQQLVRTMLLTRELTAKRKTREIMLALQVEQALSKDRILEIYMNEIFLGQRAYGFAAASRTYFGKSMDELSVAEIAVLAGLPQNPHYANPVANYDRAIARQRKVLERMLANDVLDKKAYQAALAEKVVLHTRQPRQVNGGYVAEMARQQVVKQFGEIAYSKGLRVITSLRSGEQQAAHEAVRRQLLAYDATQAWRGPEAREDLPKAKGADEERLAAEALKGHRDDDMLRAAIVLEASPKQVVALLSDGNRVTIRGDGLARAKAGLQAKARPELRIGRGAIVRVMHGGRSQPAWSIVQWPEAEAALVALDSQTGRVRALVGGFDFSRQPFNRATQAWRQPGSSFKPILYSAALESRVMPSTLIDDLPLSTGDGWAPDNSHGAGEGAITLRKALTVSSNLASVRVLGHVGVPTALEWSKRFGLDPQRQPSDLTLALGTGAVTPMQMARAYAVFANGGYLVSPVIIERVEDANGKVLFEAARAQATPSPTRVISRRNAFVMDSLLNDVTRTGTAAAAQRSLRRSDLHGKTGTTDQAVDAWFAGYHSSVAAVSWMGYDVPRSLGSGGSGSRLALPIWIDYMRVALQGVPSTPLPDAPPGLVFRNDDWVYGEWLEGGAVASITDAQGTVYAAPRVQMEEIVTPTLSGATAPTAGRDAAPTPSAAHSPAAAPTTSSSPTVQPGRAGRPAPGLFGFPRSGDL
ncbi:PBP1A family penicillin-binding protein [Hydrogenophaga sp. 5NK40-0174]|uniref:penicillin-binding protein 1A n=1 Tax=Hydrogenophaga sp. 5NK40-0174 TaxID=3127649 RepID=UPI00334188BE